jgi:hypothetical protein
MNAPILKLALKTPNALILKDLSNACVQEDSKEKETLIQHATVSVTPSLYIFLRILTKFQQIMHDRFFVRCEKICFHVCA